MEFSRLSNSRRPLWQPTQYTLSTFADAVLELTSPLASEYGITLALSTVGPFQERIFRGSNEHCEVSVTLQHASIDMSVGLMAPATETTQRIRSISLLWLLLYLAPETHFGPRKMKYMDEIQDELKYQLDLLIEYCDPILRGDIDLFGKIDSWLHTHDDRHHDETPEEWQTRMRHEAREAIKNGQYTLAMDKIDKLMDKRIKLTLVDKLLMLTAIRKMPV